MQSSVLGTALLSLSDELMAYAQRHYRGLDGPDDIVQDAFVRVGRQVNRSKTEVVRLIRESEARSAADIPQNVNQALRQVAFRAAKCAILDRQKQRDRQVCSCGDIGTDAEDHRQRDAASLLDANAICGCIMNAASDSERRILELISDGLSQRQVAELCQIHPTTICRLLRRIREQFANLN